jgi:hypothetical protein
MPSRINTAIMRIPLRAERLDAHTAAQTFVSSGGLDHVLLSRDHQIIYGRRGTGKTHALTYLQQQVRSDGDISIMLDLRVIGSSGSLYEHQEVSIAERGTRLILDVFGEIHEQLVDYALQANEAEEETDEVLPLLDQLADEISRVQVVGSTERESTLSARDETSRKDGIGIAVGATPRVEVSTGSDSSRSFQTQLRLLETGTAQHSVHFGALVRLLEKITAALPGRRIWVLLDEWSAIPLELQPLLADILRRTMFPVRRITVKIGAIDQRSRFYVSAGLGHHLGIEVGADTVADLDLDDFLIFDNDKKSTHDFFVGLLLKHVRAQLAEDKGDPLPISTPQQLLYMAFDNPKAFAELIRASEGIPRDALNIAGLAARRAGNLDISTDAVRSAARKWYLRDKESAVAANPLARSMLDRIIDQVIRERRARAFLLREGEELRNELIQYLYDCRVLHIMKRSISAQDMPGVRFNAFRLDYGCYIELMMRRMVDGLFMAERIEGESRWVEVPRDNYRSVRRAVLEVADLAQERFEKSLDP